MGHMCFILKKKLVSTRITYFHRQFLFRSQRMDKSSGFVEEDNSGRSNIFSTGDKALYSYSPTTDKIVNQGLGGLQGLVIVLTIAGLVAAITVSIGVKTGYTNA